MHPYFSLKPATNERNPWFREFWSVHFDCQFPDSVSEWGNSSFDDRKFCTGEETLSEENGIIVYYSSNVYLIWIQSPQLKFTCKKIFEVIARLTEYSNWGSDAHLNCGQCVFCTTSVSLQNTIQ